MSKSSYSPCISKAGMSRKIGYVVSRVKKEFSIDIPKDSFIVSNSDDVNTYEFKTGLIRITKWSDTSSIFHEVGHMILDSFKLQHLYEFRLAFGGWSLFKSIAYYAYLIFGYSIPYDSNQYVTAYATLGADEDFCETFASLFSGPQELRGFVGFKKKTVRNILSKI